VVVVGRCRGVTELNIELLLDSLFTRDLSLLAGAMGVVVYLLIAGSIACLYAVSFEHVTQRASWAVGLLFSLAHLGMTGLAMDALGDIHPLLIRPSLPLLEGHMLAPGLFAANFGVMTMVGFVALHFVSNGMVGAMSQVGRQHRPVPAVR